MTISVIDGWPTRLKNSSLCPIFGLDWYGTFRTTIYSWSSLERLHCNRAFLVTYILKIITEMEQGRQFLHSKKLTTISTRLIITFNVNTDFICAFLTMNIFSKFSTT